MLVAERYRLGELLGRGGMGEVFRGVDEVLGRPVAVKLLRPTDRDPAAAERFRREARSAAILNDSHVIAVYDFGQHGDRSFLVMELVEGRSVAEELVQTGPLPRDRAIDIIEQAAAGLAAAHRHDIVHRDIKPGNLLLAADGTVKIADFGIAHLADEGSATLTVTGQIIGSTHYLAPERAQGRPAGTASDIYALGCVLYQLVVGHPPFTAEHPTAILYQHVDADPVPPSRQDPELGGAFEALLLRMLAKDPAARPTATEIAGGALRAPAPAAITPAGAAVLGAAPEGSTLTDAAVPAPVGQPADGESGVAEGGSGAGPLAGRRKYLVAAAAALVATAATVAAAVLIDGNETQPPATTNLDPKPSVAPSTPGRTPSPTATNPSTTRTQPGAANPSTPVRSPSQQGTPTPSTSPSATPTSSPSTPSRSTPTQSSDTPSARPTSTTPPPEPSPSPSSRPSTSGTPSVAPQSPAANGDGPPPGSD